MHSVRNMGMLPSPAGIVMTTKGDGLDFEGQSLVLPRLEPGQLLQLPQHLTGTVVPHPLPKHTHYQRRVDFRPRLHLLGRVIRGAAPSAHVMSTFPVRLLAPDFPAHVAPGEDGVTVKVRTL